MALGSVPSRQPRRRGKCRWLGLNGCDYREFERPVFEPGLGNRSDDIVSVSVGGHTGERTLGEEMQRLLTETTRLLGANLDSRQTLARIADLTLSSLADWCVIETVDVDGSFTQVAVAHRDPVKAELVREMRRRYPPQPERPNVPLRVLNTGSAEFLPEVSDGLLAEIAQNADHLNMLQELRPTSLIVVPLWTRERFLGTILLANAESGRRFSLADLELAEDLGKRVALAIDNAMLLESERDARREAERAVERIAGLQAVTAALSRAVTPSAVAEVFVREGAAAVGASGGFIRLLTHDERSLRLHAAVGYSSRFQKSYKNLPVTSDLPGAEVFRTVSERYFESTSAAAASPDFARELEATGHEAVAFLPLHTQRRPIGVMALSYADPRVFDATERALLRTLADQCTQALERARLYRTERKARAAAERAVERTTRLQSLAAELAGALTPAQVAEVVVTQGIASVRADAGALQLLTADGKRLEVVCGLGSDRSLIEEEWRSFSIDLKVPSTDALHRLTPVFIESERDISERYPGVAKARSTLGARPGAHIPLVLPGGPLGVLFLGFSRPRTFSKSQRSFVLALGRQCAQALKRAQLYEAELKGRSGLSRLVERLHEGVFSVDRHGRVEFASSKAKEMLSSVSLEEGRRVPEAWLGFPLRRFVTGLFTADETIIEAQVVSEDDGRVFDVTGIPAARTDAALLVVTDVSERERRWRAEREFVDNAAHELRTPLAAITSAIERLQGGARDVPEKRDRFLGHIQQESSRLNHLASSLLMLARAQTREEAPRREEIALRRLLEELFVGLDVNPGVEVVVDCSSDLIIWSNRDLLEHALLNLASNAARHTDCGRIRVSARLEADSSLTIALGDTGSGIRPEELDRLFDRFYRGPTEERRSGFGLGLPITKEAVEALGGRIEIDSVVGAGTTARIVLPAQRVPA
jgi:signal transduction histidine kinase/transcriptional regulator with GAF, ATPase, and Fis domain